MEDLDEELEQLGYGNLWDEQMRKLSTRHDSDLERLKKYNQDYPEKHKQDKRKWYLKRKEEVKGLIGQPCDSCKKPLKARDAYKIGGMVLPKPLCIKCYAK